MRTKTTKATTYQIDVAHSEIAFSIKHLMITSIRGMFTQFEGRAQSAEMNLDCFGINKPLPVLC